MDFIKDFFVHTYWGGLIFLFWGIWEIRDTIINPQKDASSILQEDFRGGIGGVGLIVLGLFVIWAVYTGKL